MEIDALKLLNYLKGNNGLHTKISIAPLIDELIPNPLDFYNYRLEMKPLYQLLYKLQDTDGFISYDEPPSPNGSTYTWEVVKNIRVELTTKGDNYLKDNSMQEVEFELNKRSLESHELSQLVNKSVITTNDKMVSISIDQANTNKIIADNTTTQTSILEGQAEILKRQTWIFFATAIFALLACIIAGVSLSVEILKDQSEKQQQQQTKKIKELRIRIKTLMNDTSAGSTAKKNLPKKN